MIAVRRRCRLAFVRGALEKPRTPQNMAGMGARQPSFAFYARVLLEVFDGRGLNQLCALFRRGEAFMLMYF
jgi:hypothetical protein